MPSTMGIINGLLQNGAATDVGHILDKLCAEVRSSVPAPVEECRSKHVQIHDADIA